MATPKKFFKVLQLTPKTKKIVCVLCGNRTEVSDYRRRLFRGIKKTEYCLLIEELLSVSITEDYHTDTVCRKCLKELQKAGEIIRKLKRAHENTMKQLKETHGRETSSFKRQFNEEPETRSRKALFTPSTPDISSAENIPDSVDLFVPPRAFANEIEVLVSYSGFGRRRFSVKRDYVPIITAIIEGKSEVIGKEVMNNSELQVAVTGHTLSKLNNEIKSLCSKDNKSLLRNKDTDSFLKFSWHDISQEWQQRSPLFHQFLDATVSNPSQERNKLKKGDSILPSVISAGCKLLSIYSKDMNLLQSINSLILLKGGCKKSSFTRLNATNDCLCYQATLALAERVGNKWSDDIISWKEAVESDIAIEQNLMAEIFDLRQTLEVLHHEAAASVDTMFQLAELERQLENHKMTMHPGYYFVGDNVDMQTSVRHMTLSNQAKDQHMFQMCAYINRVSGNMLDNSKPKGDIETVQFKTFLPSADDMTEMYKQMALLVAIHWCRMIPYFRQFERVINPVIEHPYMKDTKKCSHRINLGVLQKNEQYNDDMTDICTFLHQYVPGHDSSDSWQTKPEKVLSGGDYLTFERHKQAKASKRDGRTPTKRLEGLIPKMEEFHNECEFLTVVWKLLYSTSSAKDSGTLYSARNAVNARKVTKSPSDDFYASSDLFEKFTIAYIVSGGLHYFKMESAMSEPNVHVYTGEIGHQRSMKEYIMRHAESFVKTYAEIHIPQLPDFGPQSNDLKCRYCQKQYQKPKALRKHEANIHGQPDPLYNATDESSLVTPEHQDFVLNYTKLSLSLGLLRLNQMDALKLGDGDRIMNINQILYLFYKVLGFPKYAHGMLETLTQAKVLLSERMAHRLVWNRTVNHRGEIHSNHPNDLDVEHCNKAFKEDAHSYRGVFTDKTISRVSHSALYVNDITKTYDKMSRVFGQSGKHTDADISDDILLLVRQFQAAKVFDCIPTRSHQAYPMFESNPLLHMDMEQFQSWISECLKKFAKKHFYKI